MRKILLIFLIVLGAYITNYAQEEDFDDPEKIRIPSDSTSAPIQNGTLQTFRAVFEGKPGKAAAYAFCIPGGGQLYNKRYWKAPIVWAADATAIGFFIYNRNLWLEFQEALELKIDDPSYVHRGISSEESIRSLRNQFQLDTERAGIAILIVHVASVVEAFTDRHLMEFDVSEDLSYEIKPQVIPFTGAIPSLGIVYTF